MALSKRWYALRDVPQYAALTNSTARFDVIEGGRRSGKTELVKRMGIEEAIAMSNALGARWYTKFCAPTLRQSRDIYWDDLLALTKGLWAREPNKTDLVIYLRGGAELWVCGLDKPQRIEGSPVNRLAIDELADVKEGAWDRHLRPALDTEQAGYPPARAWLFGVPRPGGQFAKLAELAKNPQEPDFAYHTWTSEAVLSPEKIAAAKRTMDPRIYAQEYLAQRVAMEGRAYFQYGPENVRELHYQPGRPIAFCFDFNRSPGIAVVVQEQDMAGLIVGECVTCGAEKPGLSGEACKHCTAQIPLALATCVIGEVFIESGSNTPMVCTRLCNDWGHHEGALVCYGDASGGAQKSSGVDGSDWELVRKYLAKTFPQAVYDVPRANHSERSRVNSVNMRCCNALGEVRLFVDSNKAANTHRDLNSQEVVKGGSGELEKYKDETLGHSSDGLGYYTHRVWPATGGESESVEAA